MKFNDIIQFLLPKEDKFFILLEQQSQVLHQAATTLATSAQSNMTSELAYQAVREIEHQGDELVDQMEKALAETFITPIDREDIHTLSTEMDDVIDFCNSAARFRVLYNVHQPTIPMFELMQIIVSCAEVIHNSMPALRTRQYHQFLEAKKIIKKLEKEADVIYRSAVSDLFNSDVSYKIFFSQKSVLEKLENAIDRCEDISCVLTNLVMKYHG